MKDPQIMTLIGQRDCDFQERRNLVWRGVSAKARMKDHMLTGCFSKGGVAMTQSLAMEFLLHLSSKGISFDVLI
jgi:hypothetical protein